MSLRHAIPVLVLILLSIVPQAAAQSAPIWIVPTAPTTQTPISIFVSFECPPGPPSVTVLGKVIKVHFSEPQQTCGIIPDLQPYRADVPSLLAAGEYRIDVTYGAIDSIIATMTFIVRGDVTTPFFVRPFAVPANVIPPLKLRFTANSAICANAQCRIFVGGVEATEKTIAPDGAIFFDAPPHAPGLVDVEVRSGDMVQRVDAALYYFARDGNPDLSFFERVLFPVLFNAPGANGSLWRTDAAISNPRGWFVEAYNSILPIVCIDYPCGERFAPARVERFSGGAHPNGVALLVPREEATSLSFSLRARDVSRQSESFGTEVPVVREADMFRNTSTLLSVPLDPRYRVKLRVYAFDVGRTSANETRVTTVAANGDRRSEFRTLVRSCSGSCAEVPYYAELDLAPGAANDVVDVYVDLPTASLGWAFASVTNNETQQVTIVTPNGAGGLPCEFCTLP